MSAIMNENSFNALVQAIAELPENVPVRLTREELQAVVNETLRLTQLTFGTISEEDVDKLGKLQDLAPRLQAIDAN